jgi:hypothetical protein
VDWQGRNTPHQLTVDQEVGGSNPPSCTSEINVLNQIRLLYQKHCAHVCAHTGENYRFRAYGDYHPWPGPNSNTFVQAALDAVPELNAVLPPTAIGKDYPYHGEWYGLTPSRTGIFLNFAGYLGLKIG